MVVLIIGFGSIAQKHYSILKKIDPECKVYALRSSREVSDIPDVTSIYSYEECTIKPDFIIISSPTSNHYSDIENCLRFRCPLFVEKPMLDSTEKSQELMKKVEVAGITFYVACVLRFHPCISYLKNNIVNQYRINEVNVYCGSYLPDWRPGKNFRELYSAHKSMGGGVHLDLIHELDYSYWLFGMPEYWHSYTTSKSSLQINAIDAANYLLSYPDFNVHITLNYFRRKAKRTIEILTVDTTYSIDLLNYTILDDSNQTIFSSPEVSIMDLYEKQLQYFISCVKENKTCENDFKSGIDTLNICLTNNYVEK